MTQVKVKILAYFETILHSQQQRLVTLNGEDGKMIVKAFTFAKDQVKAVRLIARYTVWSLF